MQNGNKSRYRKQLCGYKGEKEVGWQTIVMGLTDTNYYQYIYNRLETRLYQITQEIILIVL